MWPATRLDSTKWRAEGPPHPGTAWLQTPTFRRNATLPPMIQTKIMRYPAEWSGKVVILWELREWRHTSWLQESVTVRWEIWYFEAVRLGPRGGKHRQALQAQGTAGAKALQEQGQGTRLGQHVQGGRHT